MKLNTVTSLCGFPTRTYSLVREAVGSCSSFSFSQKLVTVIPSFGVVLHPFRWVLVSIALFTEWFSALQEHMSGEEEGRDEMLGSGYFQMPFSLVREGELLLSACV